MLTRILLLSLLAASCYSLPALADGNKLLDECQDGISTMNGGSAKNPVGVGHCVGVLQATMDTLDMTHELNGTRKMVCIPEGGIPMVQSMRVVVKFLQANPQSLQLNESVLVALALKSSFGCE
jgi:hypothetical protein